MTLSGTRQSTLLDLGPRDGAERYLGDGGFGVKLAPAADFYALGASLHEALSERLPFMLTEVDTPLSGGANAALEVARHTHDLCRELGQVHYGYNAAYLLGLLEGEAGKGRRDAALAALSEQGWRDPFRAATMLVPYARREG